MATVLSVGDIAIVHYNSRSTDSFTFVFMRESRPARPSISPTTAGWLPADSGRAKDTVTYTAAGRDHRRHDRHADGLDLDDAGDQIIAYQGDPATPTILHVVDLPTAKTVAGDATEPTPPPCRPDSRWASTRSRSLSTMRSTPAEQGIPRRLSPAVSNSANWINSDSARVPDPRAAGNRSRCRRLDAMGP